MSLANRIEKLEAKLKPQEDKVTFYGWADCEWKHANGLTRAENETKEQFFKRVRKTTDSKFIWCK
ncbi:hypothetical protein [Polynucleobacter brandtiae]|uniref:hypothetical protein n=1 Tax=Polynucleobacter brandtiae TaxID=1938816 RepID=UPI000C23F180|nr:hypothetical protein [Polynucleobacter brandtiae]